MGRRRTLEWLAVAAPIAFALAAYQGALAGAFVFDDHQFWGYRCWQIDDLSSLTEVVQAECRYRPIRYLSLAIDHVLYGNDPAGYHRTNILLHAVMVGLVFAFLHELLRHRLAASLGALLWGLHPVHTDVVTYVAGRRDVLFALFFMAAYLLWPTTSRRIGRPILRGVVSVCLFVLAFRSKEMAVTLPAVIVLSGFIIFNGAGPPTAWTKRVPKGLRFWLLLTPLLVAFGAAAWFVYFRGFLAPVTGSMNRLFGGDLYHHVLSVLAAYAKYFELIVFPASLYGDYSGFALPQGLSDYRVWLGFTVICLVWGGGLFFRRRAPFISFGLLWFGVTMLPVSHIIPHHELLAEHYLYIPLVGLVVPIAWAIREGLTGPRTRLAVQVAVLLVCSLYVARISSRNEEFQSERTFAEVVIANDPNTIRGYLTLAHAHQVEGELEQAGRALETVLQRMERTNRFYLEARRNLLTTYTDLRDFDRAAPQAVILMTEFPNESYGFQVMGTILAQQGRYEEAIDVQLHGVELTPDDVEGRLHLGVTYMAAGRHEEAEEHLRFAVERWDNNAYAHVQYGMFAVEMRRADEALQHFERALELEPANIHALEYLIPLHRQFFDPERGCHLYWVLRTLQPELQAQPPICPRPQ